MGLWTLAFEAFGMSVKRDIKSGLPGDADCTGLIEGKADIESTAPFNCSPEPQSGLRS
jgi:hypothetical protein